MEIEKEGVEGFYAECAKLLGVTHEYRQFPFRKRTRWNNRTAGNGRFGGRGLIRVFSSKLIHMSLTSPKVNRQFTSFEDALDFLRTL